MTVKLNLSSYTVLLEKAGTCPILHGIMSQKTQSACY